MKKTGTVAGIVLVVVLALLLLGGAGMMGFGGFGMMGPGMMGGYGGYGGMMGGYGFNPFGMILSLVIWALIIGGIVLLVVWLARNAGRTTLGASSGDAPLDILKARYARGEINKEQFDAIKQDLGA
ncbi:hypothetical protein ANAEL_03784 [Anaerolineales bacterium]|nr:hypothetical protein ANAEL_03784 [Anaerolineales bacterium]